MKTIIALLLLITLVSSHVAEALSPVVSQLETILDVEATSTVPPRVNRDGGIATLYKTDRNGPDHLYFLGDGVSADFQTTDTRYVNMRLSNWGATILDFAGAGTAVAAAPFGQAPQEVFRAGSSSSEGGLNDNGRIAIFAREDNSHGLRDAYFSEQGQTPTLLPDLNEDAILQPGLVDAAGRIVARHRFRDPVFSVDIFRHTDGIGWENLTAGRLPDDVFVASSAGLPPESAISPEGDFIFGGVRDPVVGTRSHEIFLWDESEQSNISVFNHSSEIAFDTAGRPRSMGIEAQLSTYNDLWIVASRSVSASFTEFKYLYRKGDGSTIDIDALLPAGKSVLTNPYAHTMNFDGDLWLAARDDSTELISYYLLEGGQLHPVIKDTEELFFQPVLTNSHDLYFWRPIDNDHDNLVRFAIRVPEPSAIWLLLLGWAFAWKFGGRWKVVVYDP